MDVRPSGMTRDVKLEQWAKAYDPIVVTELGIIIDEAPEHVSNACIAMVSNPAGRINSVNDVQCSKAYDSMSLTVSGIVMDVNFWQ